MVQVLEANLRHVYNDFRKQRFYVVIFGIRKMMLRSSAFVKNIATISWSLTDSSSNYKNKETTKNGFFTIAAGEQIRQ